MATIAEANALAGRLGIQKEVVYGYVNAHNGALPPNLAALNEWGGQPDPNYGIQRRDSSGGWHPITPGPTPGQDPNDPNFHHVIANLEDSRIEPSFQFPDPTGVGARLLGGDRQTMQAFGVGAGGGVAGALTNAAAGKTLPQMTSELQVARYPGPWDEASVRAAYQRTATGADGGSGGGDTGSGGYTDLLNQVADTNREKWEFDKLKAQHDMALADTADKRQQAYLDYTKAQQEINALQFQDTRYDAQRQADLTRNTQENQYNLNRYDTNNQADLNRYDQNTQFEQTRYDQQRQQDQSLYSTMAQNILKASVDLGSRPEDYFKYNQMLSGGRDILAQLSGNQANAAFSAPTGKLQAGQVGDVMSALGMSGYGALPHSQADQNGTEAEWMAARGPGARPVIGPEPVTPRPDLPFMPAQTDYRVGASQAVPRLKAGYEALLKQAGTDHLASDDPRLLALYRSVTGLDEMGARNVAAQAAEYFASTNGTVIPDGVLAGAIAQEHSLQQNTDPGQRTAANMVQSYIAQVRKSGQTALAVDDPRLQAIYTNIAGLDPQAALQAARQSASFYNASGGVSATGSDLIGIMAKARAGSQAAGRNPTAAPPVPFGPSRQTQTMAPTPTAQNLMRTANAAAQPAGAGYVDLGWKSGEGYDAVQDPTSGARYYRTAQGQYLDPQSGAQVAPPRPPAGADPYQNQLLEMADPNAPPRQRRPQLVGAY